MTVHSGAELGKRLMDAGSRTKGVQRRAVDAAGKNAKALMEGAAVAARTKGVHVVTQPFAHADTGAAVNVKYRPAGWTMIMEGFVRPHFIGPTGAGNGSLRRQGSMRGSRRATRMAVASLLGGTVGAGTHGAINIKGIGPKAYAHHPGVHHQKGFVPAGIKAAEPVATKTYQKTVVTEWAGVFRG